MHALYSVSPNPWCPGQDTRTPVTMALPTRQNGRSRASSSIWTSTCCICLAELSSVQDPGCNRAWETDIFNFLMCSKWYGMFSSVQSLSHGWLFVTPMNCSTPGFPVNHKLLELTQIHVHWVSDAIQPSHPLLSPFPPAYYLSQHQGLPNKSALLIRWPKYWST